MSTQLTFACTVVHTEDGRTFQAGDVVRPTGAMNAWADCVVLGFSKPDRYGDVYVRLVRPYCYASGIGTTCPRVLTGHEEFTSTLSKLKLETVVSSRPMVQGSDEPVKRGYADEVIDLRTKWALTEAGIEALKGRGAA
jgi:hypothetical protein